jgi:hypothetical protein
MPPLPTYFRTLLAHEPLPLAAATAAEYLETLDVTRLRTVAQKAVDLLGQGMGPVLVGLGLRKSELRELLTADALAAHSRFAAITHGAGSLDGSPADPDLILIVQRALQAVGARVAGAPRALLLSQWGTDGQLGEETTQAIAALQTWLGTGGPPGRLGPAEAAALLRTLRSTKTPDLWAPLSGSAATHGPAGRIVDIARGICQATPQHPFTRRVDGRVYSYSAEDFAVTSTHSGTLRAPGGVAYSVSPGRDYWKCNIFGGTCLSLAELPVPTFEYAPGSPRHFPRAERFGERLAQKPGWKLLRHLDHRDPQDLTRALTGPVQDGQVRELLLAVRPGDMLFVDHPGEPGDDGGHTRVCTEAAAPGDANLAPAFAQARYDRAQEQRDGLDVLAGGHELCFWLLRYT